MIGLIDWTVVTERTWYQIQKPDSQSRFKIGDNLISSEKNVVCNRFNDVFGNIGHTLAKSITKKSPLSYIWNRLTESIYLEPVTEKEINAVINVLKEPATGFGDMNSMFLKISSVILVKPRDDPMFFNNYSVCPFKVYWKKRWRMEFQPSLKYVKSCMKINMAFETNHLIILLCFHS